VAVSGPTMKEILKNPPAGTEKEVNKGSAKKKVDKGAEKAPVKEKPKRKGPLDALPHSLEEWSQYDVPEEVSLHNREPDLTDMQTIRKNTFKMTKT